MAADLLAAALTHHQAGHLAEAEAIYRRILAADPNHPDALHLLGLLFHQAGRSDLAQVLIQRAIVLNPRAAAFHNNLSEVLRKLGQPARAAESAALALSIRPDFAEALLNAAMALEALGDLSAAEDHARRALALRPGQAGPYLTLGNILHAAGALDHAAEAFAGAVSADPLNALAHNNLGLALMELGRAAEAQRSLTRAIELHPDYREARSNLLLALHYDSPADQPGSLFQAHVEFARRLPSSPPRPLPNRPANPRVRIGYVSPDFRHHPVSLFVLPVIESHDRGRFDVFCYSDGRQSDELTARFASLSTYRAITGLADGAVVEMIRGDRIDILVDLAGHTAGNRLGVFAQRPAPLQVTWLGYPDTTGLASIDLRITDALCDPPAAAAWHSERLLHLPHGFLPFAASQSPGTSDPPALANGFVTFGSFNNLAKVGPMTLALWGAILRAVPRSRLLLKARALSSASARNRIIDALATHSIDPGRLEFCPPLPEYASHLDAYSRIDIALDSFPYHGTTTTCEALWMGVPVITRVGGSHCSRVGLSILTRAGHADWAADTDADFTAIAGALASDIPRLATIRRNLRGELRPSALCDIARFVRDFEAALLSAMHETAAM